MAVRLPEAFGADGIFDLAAERKSRSTVEAKRTGPAPAASQLVSVD
jgi:hypothetical protein